LEQHHQIAAEDEGPHQQPEEIPEAIHSLRALGQPARIFAFCAANSSSVKIPAAFSSPSF
jgi:hypothetical protein